MKNLLFLILIFISSLGFTQQLSPNYDGIPDGSGGFVDEEFVFNGADNQKLLKLLNDYREENGLPILKYNPKLDEASKLQVMYTYSIRESTHSNEYYPKIGDRVEKVGFSNWTVVNECSLYTPLPKGDIEEGIIKQYQESPPHNSALLNENMKQIGFYTIYDGTNLYNVLVMTNKL